MSYMQPSDEKDGSLPRNEVHANRTATNSAKRVFSTFSGPLADGLGLDDLKKIVEFAPFAIILVQVDGTFRYVNRKFLEIFGYDLLDAPNGREFFTKAYPDLAYRRKAISTWINDLQKIPSR